MKLFIFKSVLFGNIRHRELSFSSSVRCFVVTDVGTSLLKLLGKSSFFIVKTAMLFVFFMISCGAHSFKNSNISPRKDDFQLMRQRFKIINFLRILIHFRSSCLLARASSINSFKRKIFTLQCVYVETLNTQHKICWHKFIGSPAVNWTSNSISCVLNYINHWR